MVADTRNKQQHVSTNSNSRKKLASCRVMSLGHANVSFDVLPPVVVTIPVEDEEELDVEEEEAEEEEEEEVVGHVEY